MKRGKNGGYIVVVKGYDEIIRNFRKSPHIVSKYVNRAIKASVYEIDKENEDRNLQFKTPRALRTGRLQRSISSNIILEDMHGEIGPNVYYAEYVHRKNKFMPRLLRIAQPRIDKHFETAVDKIIKELAK